jgi:hypothetical protein
VAKYPGVRTFVLFAGCGCNLELSLPYKFINQHSGGGRNIKGTNVSETGILILISEEKAVMGKFPCLQNP